jgi:dipeptidase D
MLNLDSEEDDALYIGCAGGSDTTLTWDFKAAPPPQRTQSFRVTVAGLRGGHSGVDIHLNRASAVKLLVRTLVAGGEGHLRLAELRGGSKRNVIPREASALVLGPAKAAANLSAVARQIQAEAVSTGEIGCSIKVEPADTPAPLAASAADTARLLTALVALPHGVLAVVPEIAGLVQTSNSTSTLESALVDGKLRVVVGCLSRSSSMPQLEATTRQLVAIGQLAGALVECGNGYPGWQPNVKSALLVTCRRIYEQLFGATPRVAAIHAGLECGIIGERVGGQMDMISFGPHIEGAHSPDEKVWVASVQKTWKYLKAVLAELAKG